MKIIPTLVSPAHLHPPPPSSPAIKWTNIVRWRALESTWPHPHGQVGCSLHTILTTNHHHLEGGLPPPPRPMVVAAIHSKSMGKRKCPPQHPTIGPISPSCPPWNIQLEWAKVLQVWLLVVMVQHMELLVVVEKLVQAPPQPNPMHGSLWSVQGWRSLLLVSWSPLFTRAPITFSSRQGGRTITTTIISIIIKPPPHQWLFHPWLWPSDCECVPSPPPSELVKCSAWWWSERKKDIISCHSIGWPNQEVAAAPSSSSPCSIASWSLLVNCSPIINMPPLCI